MMSEILNKEQKEKAAISLSIGEATKWGLGGYKLIQNIYILFIYITYLANLHLQ
jgi:hypothetical protein